MFYHLLTPLSEHYLIFNLFNYISFRAAGATVTAILMAFLIGPGIIRRLRQKKIEQVIRAEGPATHLGKRGTPTMGGVIILLSTVIPTLLWARLDTRFVPFALLATLWMGAIGFLDDWLKIVQGKSRGLVAKWKLVGQVSFGLVLGLLLVQFPVVPVETMPATATSLPFFKFVTVNFQWWAYVGFVTIVIAGSSNAVNLTDGLDGLAIGPTLVTSMTYLIFAYIAGHEKIAEYLQIQHIAGAGELAVFCGALMGAGLGFLWFNTYPAQVFMGDVGSLAIGAAIGTVAIMVKQEILLVLVGGIFVLEALSVMIQVVSFKLTGKRVFKMAPIHHHFELKGWMEPKVIVRFWIISIILAILALTTLKLR